MSGFWFSLGLLAAGAVEAEPAPRTARDLLEAQQFRQAAPLMRPLLAKARPDAAERALIYDWLFAVDDLAEVERRSATGSAAVDLLAAGRLALEGRDFERAGQLFERALREADSAAHRAPALRGLGLLAHQRRDYEGALRQLEAARREAATADVLVTQSEILVRLGRTNEAVAALEEAIRLNPDHEAANYQLGNGYTRRNYSELARDCGDAGFERAAHATRRASDAFERGRLDLARQGARAALRACPGYGRAHAVLAKVAESERLAVDVHRAAHERRFAATPMPEVPQIERYVLNWRSLSARHRKRVALSIAPWKAYVPILVAGGATHYIKPLYLRLSETPGAAALRDARIDYDSRLWDDVRGVGGHMTVTGIEDVERSVFGRYNTVLHELTHQVHGVMTAAHKREIQELYRQAKERDARTGEAFLSRYAGGSVWEYFAEGANSLDSPRRDRFDHREIVRERLVAHDPALQALVLRHFAAQDVAASLPVALVNGGQRHLEAGELEAGQALLTRALGLAPEDEQVLGANLYGLALRGQAGTVEPLAARALARHPDSGALRVAAADALWHGGRALAPLVTRLAAGREALRAEDGFEVDLALGGYALHQGRAEAALQIFDRALAQQGDSPEALWGRAAALALASRWDEAFVVYERALRLRTGILALRLDLVRDLMLAGRVEAARVQLAEARTLRATEPQLLALEGWLALRDGRHALALDKADAALARAAWCESAQIVRAVALRGLGRDEEGARMLAALRNELAQERTPRYVYRADIAGWESVRRHSAALRRMLGALAPD
ncbi:tetratricopeptide repeat protein [Roseateles sp. DAIF2]|uniref:tetratricopeptide repeat protein n=1 Tax=Roseateles sp. DAIF2 TaxID=2714952 RepID=UPI0018A2FFDA|nr:tetratricopeptide repeat protein [Roseateles sp. DAIF2]QPF72564.1 tetratricopeptide repeat protein [Roseateles sp. DAIF2]